MAELPVLTPFNQHKYNGWHSYFHAVYSENVSGECNLNVFTWFYWWAPVENVSIHMDTDFKSTSVHPGIAWVGQHQGHPEYILSEMGFFVHRKSPLSHDFVKNSRIEVLRTCKPLRMFGRSYSVDTSEGVVWFFHVTGSGFFLDAIHRTVLVKDRFSLILNRTMFTHPLKWSQEDIGWSFMSLNNISSLVMEEAFGWYVIPRSEVVIRYDTRQSGCCSYPTLTQGFRNIRPCNCFNKSGFIGCF